MSLRRQASAGNSSDNGISSELSRYNSMSVVRTKHGTTKDRNVDFEFIFTGTYKAKKTKTDAKDGTSAASGTTTTSITTTAQAVGADDNTDVHATAAAAATFGFKAS